MPDNPCNTVLIPEFDITILNQQDKVSLLDIIDQENWRRLDQERKRSLFVATGKGALDYSDDFSKFEESRAAYFRSIDYQRDYASSLQQIRIRVPDRAIAAWESCMLASLTGNYGVSATAERISDNETRVVVTARLLPQSGPMNRTVSVEEGTCSGQLLSHPPVPFKRAFPKGLILTDGVPQVFRYRHEPDAESFSLEANSSLGVVSVLLPFEKPRLPVEIELAPRDHVFGGPYTPFQPGETGGWNINLRAWLTLEDVAGDWFELKLHWDLAMNETNAYGHTQPNGMGNWWRSGNQTVARFEAKEAHLPTSYSDQFNEHVAFDGGRLNHAPNPTSLVEGWTYSVRDARAGFLLKPSVQVLVLPV